MSKQEEINILRDDPEVLASIRRGLHDSHLGGGLFFAACIWLLSRLYSKTAFLSKLHKSKEILVDFKETILVNNP